MRMTSIEHNQTALNGFKNNPKWYYLGKMKKVKNLYQLYIPILQQISV